MSENKLEKEKPFFKFKKCSFANVEIKMQNFNLLCINKITQKSTWYKQFQNFLV